jgi:hypothetical protein
MHYNRKIILHQLTFTKIVRVWHFEVMTRTTQTKQNWRPLNIYSIYKHINNVFLCQRVNTATS